MIVLYRSCRGNTLCYGIPPSAVLQNHLINDVAALDATKYPTGATPAVALQIDTHVIDHVTAAPAAAVLRGLHSGQPRCPGKSRIHGTSSHDFCG